MIKLANKSRNNRMFYDNLIKELAICIRTGEQELNEEMLFPSYVGVTRHKTKECYANTAKAWVEYKMLKEELSKKTIKDLNNMLKKATKTNKKAEIIEFLKENTDLTDCHLTALNEMQSLK